MLEKKLLIVDDEAGFVDMVLEYFRGEGYDARPALNFTDALQTFREQKPNVVIMDVNMPLLTTEKFLPVLKMLNPVVKVILISGSLEDEVQAKFKDTDYFAFFEKGNFSLAQIKRKVEEALSSS